MKKKFDTVIIKKIGPSSFKLEIHILKTVRWNSGKSVFIFWSLNLHFFISNPDFENKAEALNQLP